MRVGLIKKHKNLKVAVKIVKMMNKTKINLNKKYIYIFVIDVHSFSIQNLCSVVAVVDKVS